MKNNSFNVVLMIVLLLVLAMTLCSCGKVATQEEKIENVQMTESEIPGDILQEESKWFRFFNQTFRIRIKI